MAIQDGASAAPVARAGLDGVARLRRVASQRVGQKVLVRHKHGNHTS